jgi:Holliday junction DNA helicase RuvA
MISHLSGRIKSHSEDGLVLEVGGIGFDVLLPVTLLRQLASYPLGEALDLHIYTHIAIPPSGKVIISLVGFLTAEERTFFEELLTVSGIGVKAAARALAKPFAEVAQAVVAGDTAMLRTLPGIGPKKAEEIVHTLAPAAAKLRGRAAGEVPPMLGVWSQAREVLAQLGYRMAEAEELLGRVRARLGDDAVLEAILAEVWKG